MAPAFGRRTYYINSPYGDTGMCTPEPLNLETWPRRDHFLLFRSYQDPFFDLSVRLSAGPLRQVARARGHSLFGVVMHAFSCSMNAREPMRLRTDGNVVERWPTVHPGWTTLARDGSFRFAYGRHVTDLEDFLEMTKAATAAARVMKGLPHAFARRDLFYASCLPWLDVISIRPDRSGLPADSTPRLLWGRVVGDEDGDAFGLTLTVHHGLVDGLHAARFLQDVQRRLRDYSGVEPAHPELP